jgi:hypothetical protein
VNVLDVIGTSGSQVCQMSYRPGTLWATEQTYDLAVAPPTDPNEGVLPAFLPASVSWAADRIDVVVGLSQSSGSIVSPWHMWFNTASPPGWFGGEPY